jgi:hypothetical protein
VGADGLSNSIRLSSRFPNRRTRSITGTLGLASSRWHFHPLLCSLRHTHRSAHRLTRIITLLHQGLCR